MDPMVESSEVDSQKTDSESSYEPDDPKDEDYVGDHNQPSDIPIPKEVQHSDANIIDLCDSSDDSSTAKDNKENHDCTPREQEAQCPETETTRKFSCPVSFLYFVRVGNGRIRVTNKKPPTVDTQDSSDLTANDFFKLTPSGNLSKTKFGAFTLKEDFLPLFALVITPDYQWDIIPPFLQILETTKVNGRFEERFVDSLIGNGMFASRHMAPGSLIWPIRNVPLRDVTGINKLKSFVDEDYVMHNDEQMNQKSVPYQLIEEPRGMYSILIDNEREPDDAAQKVNSAKNSVQVSKRQRALKTDRDRVNCKPFKCECKLSDDNLEFENEETKKLLEDGTRAFNFTVSSAHGVMTTQPVQKDEELLYPYDYLCKVVTRWQNTSDDEAEKQESMVSLAKEANAEATREVTSTQLHDTQVFAALYNEYDKAQKNMQLKVKAERERTEAQKAIANWYKSRYENAEQTMRSLAWSNIALTEDNRIHKRQQSAVIRASHTEDELKRQLEESEAKIAQVTSQLTFQLNAERLKVQKAEAEKTAMKAALAKRDAEIAQLKLAQEVAKKPKMSLGIHQPPPMPASLPRLTSSWGSPSPNHDSSPAPSRVDLVPQHPLTFPTLRQPPSRGNLQLQAAAKGTPSYTPGLQHSTGKMIFSEIPPRKPSSKSPGSSRMHLEPVPPFTSGSPLQIHGGSPAQLRIPSAPEASKGTPRYTPVPQDGPKNQAKYNKLNFVQMP